MADPQHVREQYRTTQNLDARIRLHQRFSTNAYGWLPWLFDQLELPPGAWVLEVGCGTGQLWAENRDRVPPGWHIVLTDRSSGMAQQTRAACEGLPQLLTVAVADVEQLPFADAVVDAVIANHMLYHVPDIPVALRELRRVVRPGGRIFTATNGAGHLRELIDLVAAFDPTLPFAAQVGARYALENAPILLGAAWSDVEVRHYDDALHVTEPQALIDYVLSAASVQALPEARRAALATFVREQFQQAGGALTITKQAGIGCGRRP